MGLKVGSGGKGKGRLRLEKESDSREHHRKLYEGDDNYSFDNLERDIPDFFDDPDVSAVQIIWDIHNPDTGHTTTVSKVITEEQYYDSFDEYDSFGDYLDDAIDDDVYAGYEGASGGVSVAVYS